MAIISWNALSTNLFGSFEAAAILPDAAMLTGDTGTRYPVLYLLHDEGQNALGFLRDPELEKLCNEKQMIICAPWIAHSFGHDLRWGAKFGKYAEAEFPGICRNMFPVSAEEQYIGGVGTGAYAALMIAARNPGSFRGCAAYNGIYDMEKVCRETENGKAPTAATLPMLQAIFGSADQVRDSAKDLFRVLPDAEIRNHALIGCGAGCDAAESERTARLCGTALHTGTLGQLLACLF